MQLDQIAVTSVLVQSARLSPPEYEVHRIDTAWIIKERFLVIPADVLDWERLFPERGLSFLQFFSRSYHWGCQQTICVHFEVG